MEQTCLPQSLVPPSTKVLFLSKMTVSDQQCTEAMQWSAMQCTDDGDQQCYALINNAMQCSALKHCTEAMHWSAMYWSAMQCTDNGVWSPMLTREEPLPKCEPNVRLSCFTAWGYYMISIECQNQCLWVEVRYNVMHVLHNGTHTITFPLTPSPIPS
jgi:hypothetical protein